MYTLGSFDDGSGPSLFASGTVTVAPSVTIGGVQR